MFSWEITKLNKEWHLKNKIPRNADRAQRIKWHENRAKNCACRPIPKKNITAFKKLDSLSEQTKKLEKIYQKKLEDLEELKKSVLKSAFAGKL